MKRKNINNQGVSIALIPKPISSILRLSVQILNRVGLTKLGGMISVAILILGLMLSIGFFAFQQVVGALLVLFSTVLGLFLTLLFSRISSHLGAAKKTLRTLEKATRDTQRQLAILTGDTSATYLTAFSEDADSIGRKEYEELKQILTDRDALEYQALRQIVAESRLIRMSINREDDSSGK